MNKKLFAPLAIMALSLSACSSNAPVGGNGALSAAKVAYTDAPAGCVKSTVLTAKTSGLAEMTFTPKSNWFNVWSKTPESARLIFGTYDVPKDNIYVDYNKTEKDALVVVQFADTVTKVAGVGNYSSAADAKMKVNETNISSKGLAGGVFDKNGSLEISHLDAKYACGTMKFDDGKNKLTGEFIAEVVRW